MLRAKKNTAPRGVFHIPENPKKYLVRNRLQAENMLEFKKALHSQCLLIARSSAGNGAFAVLPKAKKRTRNAVKRVGSYRAI